MLLRGGISGRGTATKKPRTRLPARYIILLLVGGFLTYSVERLLSGAVSAPLGQILLTPLLISLSTFAMLSLFLLAIPLVVGVLTYDSDLSLLLMTPLSTRLIMAEKLVFSCGQFIQLLVAIGSIILIGVGRALGLGVAYDLTAVVILLLLPIVPVSLAFLLAVLLMRWVPPSQARTITTVLGGLLGVIVYIGSQMLFRRSGSDGAADHLRGLLSDTNGAWWSNLPTTWPGRALAEVGLGHLGAAMPYLAATFVLSLLLAGLAVLLSARLFATGWVTYQEVG
jgi:ABC-2 type transport system permease protein